LLFPSQSKRWATNFGETNEHRVAAVALARLRGWHLAKLENQLFLVVSKILLWLVWAFQEMSASWINSRSDHQMAGERSTAGFAVFGRLINTCIAFGLWTPGDVKSCMQGDKFALQGALS
jgi:hypothetical protein